MRFDNLQELKNHPQVSKIPFNIYRHHFSLFDFPEHLLSIMSVENQNIEQEITKNSYLIISQTNAPFNRRYQVWLAIACGRQDISNERLLNIATHLCFNRKEIIFLACMFGNITFFDFLTQKFPLDEVKETIISENFNAFWLASRCGHLDVFQRLMQLAPAHPRNIIEAKNFEVLRSAARNGHPAIIKYLTQLFSSDFVKKMIKADNFKVFSEALREISLPVIECLIKSLAPDEVNDMIKSRDYEAFTVAARAGKLTLMTRLMQSAPTEVQNMIKASDFRAFRFAAENGHLDVIHHLIQLAPDEVQNMIKAGDFEAFRFAAENGLLDLIHHLIQLAPAEVQNMIKAGDFGAFRFAAENGHLDVIHHLIQLAPAEVQNMIEAQNFEVFKKATRKAHLDVVNRLIQELAPAKVQNMIKADNFKVFRLAAERGCLGVINLLIELAPTEVQNMIEAQDCEAFRFAVICSRLAVIDRFIELVPAKKVQKMIIANKYDLLKRTCQSIRMLEFRDRSHKIIERFLSYPKVFSYAEEHVREYSHFVNPFIDNKISSLRAKQSNQEQQDPNGVFNIIDPIEAQLLFFVLRNLIRRNQPSVQDDILFLLNIPSIRALAHTKNNALLRLALNPTPNPGVIGLLLNIDAVRQLAERNDFYRAETQGRLNLGELAQNRESSMTALTQGEQKRLERAMVHYKPKINATGGVAHIMNRLRATLAARYEVNPARISFRQGQPCTLPLQWKDFQALKLNSEMKRTAIAAYAKHKVHSAWRYLSKPNPWMHDNADYVNEDPVTHEKWSTFEAYQPIISLLYLAAIDSEFPATDGYTIETRLDGFIEELAYIARAHNWDNKRFKLSAHGEPLLGADDQPIEEEYDDGEKDKPSCFSGVKRRLFQSVRGHTLLSILTEKIIDIELRDFALCHFRNSVHSENRSAIHSALEKIISLDELTPDDTAVLTSLNISEEQERQFIAYLVEKYQEQFTDDPSFLLQIQMKLSREKNPLHVIVIGLSDLYEETKPVAFLSAISLFESKPSVQDEDQTPALKRKKIN